MADVLSLDPDLEWLDHVQPVGLVVAPSLLKDLGLVPTRQTQLDSAEVAELLEEETDKPALPDVWAFLSRILEWPAAWVAGAPGGPALPEDLIKRLPEYDTTLEPHWAVKMPGQAEGWQLLVRQEPAGVDPDARGALDGWEATPHQRFERLLRETGIPAGVLISDAELRLVYAPRGETSGWLAFPLRPLATVAGRPMLGGLKLLLHAFRLFNDAELRRLPAVLRQSREAQAAVSTALSEQVLGALHELLRGLTAAEPELIRDLADRRPHHLYEGLLTMMMRLVFVFYAEDRDLLPSRTDTAARAFYDQGYSLRGLHAKLVDDAARHPDTMDERVGGWGRMLALFRLIHAGDRTGWIRGRGGKLFDPDAFPFLEGRRDATEKPRVVKISDGCLLRLLDGLVMLKGERLSYRTLDVEQIGSVYETVMGFTVERASGSVLAIRAGKNNRTPVFVDLDELAKEKPDQRLKLLKEGANRSSLTPKQQKAIKDAKDMDALAAALEGIIDERAAPHRRVLPAGTPILQPTDERRRTGSHYTPRSLTEPIVRHALEPAFARLGPDATPEQVLELKVCDPAMGSGAFLVEACRAIASRLVQAWARWPASRPVIPADEDEDLRARRLVAQRCLYGVDRNPMAVDLARLSLWLATLARDHEFTFLDHALKCGDSLVGLNREQIAALHWDIFKPPMALLKSLVAERIQATLQGRAEIRNAPDDVTLAQQEIRLRRVEERLDQARLMGDAVIAAFFSADKPKAREIARAEIEMEAMGGAAEKMWTRLKALRDGLRHGLHPVTPFHWHLEFPEVFLRDNGGFDAIVGNPPFAGKNTIAAGNRPGTIEWLQTIHAGAHGNADLVAHFFRRAFVLLRRGGCFGLIATNTIGQGDTRQTGLEAIIQSGGAIYRVARRLRWPGDAAVVVSVIHMANGLAPYAILDGKPVQRICAFLIPGDVDRAPEHLAANDGLAFKGCEIGNLAFLIDRSHHQYDAIFREIRPNDRWGSIIRAFIGGEDLNSMATYSPERYIVDADGLSYEQLSNCKHAFSFLSSIDSGKQNKKGNWWNYRRPSGSFRKLADNADRFLAISEVGVHYAIDFLPCSCIPSHKLKIFAFASYAKFCDLQCRVHEIWARTLTSTMKDDLNYSPTDCFYNFPFPPADDDQEFVGSNYHATRLTVMRELGEGLTSIYNRFHDPRETAADILRLRELHDAMDQAVLRAYGWDDLARTARPVFLNESNEDDHKYQGRYFWPADIRDDVLARLLALNAQRAAEERALGLTPKGRGQGGHSADDEDEMEEV